MCIISTRTKTQFPLVLRHNNPSEKLSTSSEVPQNHNDLLVTQTFSNGLNVTGSVKLVPHVRMTGFGYKVVKNLESGTLKRYSYFWYWQISWGEGGGGGEGSTSSVNCNINVSHTDTDRGPIRGTEIDAALVTY